jgi:hypothetical protein
MIALPPYGDTLRRSNAHFATLKVTANSPANMKIRVSDGGFYHGTKYIEFVGGQSFTISPPAVNARWTLISLTMGGEIRISYGPESKNPIPPDIPTNDFPLALIFVEQDTDRITDTSIFDVRPFFKTPFSDHTNSIGRNNPDAHNISNITGLQSILDNKVDSQTIIDLQSTTADIDGTPSPTFTLNKDFISGTPYEDVGIYVKRGNQPTVGLKYNETENRWEISNDGSSWVAINPSTQDLLQYIPSDPNDWTLPLPTTIPQAVDTLADELTHKASINYSPATSSEWGNTVPTTIYNALDNLIYKLNRSTLDIKTTTLRYVDCNRIDVYSPDGTVAKPFKSITSCIDYMSGSYCILVMPGTYNEDVYIDDNCVLMGLGQTSTIIHGNLTASNVEVGIKDITVNGNVSLLSAQAYVSNFKCEGTVTNSGGFYGNNITLNSNAVATNSPLIISNGVINLVGVKGFCSGDYPNIRITGGNFAMHSFAIDGNQTTRAVIEATGGIVNLFSGSIINAQGPIALDLNNNPLLQNPNGLFSVTINGGTSVECNNSYTIIDGVYGGSVNGSKLLFRSAAHISYTPTYPKNWLNVNVGTSNIAFDELSRRLHNMELEQNIFA